MNAMHDVLVIMAASLLAAGAWMLPGEAQAHMVRVSNCNDSGAGSLRRAVEVAPSGATIDLRYMGCTRIALTNGQIQIRQNDLTLVGPGEDALTLDGNRRYRVLRHFGAGTLRVRGLSIANGRNSGRIATGGCIRSEGNVELVRVSIHHCKAVSQSAVDEVAYAQGGAIRATGSVKLWNSSAWYNKAITLGPGYGPSGGAIAAGGDVELRYTIVGRNASVARKSYAIAGAIEAGGFLTLYRSRMRENTVYAEGTFNAWAGAAYTGGLVANYAIVDHNTAKRVAALRVRQEVLIENSTISDNVADEGAALSIEMSRPGPLTSRIYQSTVSGNTGGSVSGIYFQQDATIMNSTIAFNHGSGACEGAVFGFDIRLESSIVAKNTCEGAPPKDIFWSYSLSGSNDIVGAPAIASSYLWYSTSADPKLAALANNGGRAPTHALLPGSPAIDKGEDDLGLLYDERGPGFPRVKGAGIDIGAFER